MKEWRCIFVSHYDEVGKSNFGMGAAKMATKLIQYNGKEQVIELNS